MDRGGVEVGFYIFPTAYRLTNPQFESFLDSGLVFQNAYLETQMYRTDF